MVGDLGGAVVGHVADENVASCCSRPCDLVVADAHAHDRAQPGKARDVFGAHRIAHYHQPVDLGAVGGVEVGEGFDLAPHDADLRPENPGFEGVVRDLSFLGVEHRYRHYETFTGW